MCDLLQKFWILYFKIMKLIIWRNLISKFLNPCFRKRIDGTIYVNRDHKSTFANHEMTFNDWRKLDLLWEGQDTFDNITYTKIRLKYFLYFTYENCYENIFSSQILKNLKWEYKSLIWFDSNYSLWINNYINYLGNNNKCKPWSEKYKIA